MYATDESQMKNRLPRNILVTGMISVALAVAGCDAYTQRGAKGIGLLPKPPDAGQHLSGYEPANPYTQLAQGVLSRKTYEVTSGPRGIPVEVDDYLVGPHQHAAAVTLPGALVLEVRLGEGIAKFNGNEEKLQSGTTLSIPAGAAIEFENRGETPLGCKAIC